MQTIFFTGFPGFLGVELLPRALQRHPDDVTATCLIQAKYRAYAEKMVRKIEETHPGLMGRISLYEGDITQPDLGLGKGRHTWLKGVTVEIFHLAAVYDLSVAKEVAWKVNVDGTRHLLELAGKCSKLERFQYVSTCYVSGKHPGLFRETDLDVGQSFNNHYEASKFEAELLVREAMEEGLPATIYRPAIVVGDSHTGETQKYDGPYYAMQWIARLPKVFVFPYLGGGKRYRVNLVPRDFVVDAIAYLSGAEVAVGKTYQLADPRPLKVWPLSKVIGEAMGRRLFKLPLPPVVAKLALRYVKPVQNWMRIPPTMIDYFTLPTVYSPENTLSDLKGTGIFCPPFKSYISTLVDFFRDHPDISSRAMV